MFRRCGWYYVKSSSPAAAATPRAAWIMAGEGAIENEKAPGSMARKIPEGALLLKNSAKKEGSVEKKRAGGLPAFYGGRLKMEEQQEQRKDHEQASFSLRGLGAVNADQANAGDWKLTVTKAFPGARFPGVKLSGARFPGVKLSGARFPGVKFPGALPVGSESVSPARKDLPDLALSRPVVKKTSVEPAASNQPILPSCFQKKPHPCPLKRMQKIIDALSYLTAHCVLFCGKAC